MQDALRRTPAAVACVLGALAGMSNEPAAAHPGGCTIAATPISFGVYRPLSPADSTARGAIVYQCSATAPIVITIDQGIVRSPGYRSMQQGQLTLHYNLYVDAANTLVWGDGTGGTTLYSNPDPPLNRSVTLPVYGRIPALQRSAHVGSYSDTLTLEVRF